MNINALLFQYEICNVSRGLSETAICAHELFRGHSHCVKNMSELKAVRFLYYFTQSVTDLQKMELWK